MNVAKPAGLLVTGFGPFGGFVENPSEALAKELDRDAPILDVSFSAVEAFLGSTDPASFDGLLLLGVAGKADKLRIECVARNRIGPEPDERGEVWGPGPIDPTQPENLAATLWKAPELFEETEHWRPSVDAGHYLCNFAFFQALARFPDKRIGFLHVAPLEARDFERQLDAVKQVLEHV